MVEPPETGATPEENTLETAIEERLKGIESGSYRRNTRLVLEEFTEWLAEQRDVTALDEIDQIDCRRYAQHLRDRANDPEDDLTARSTETYYAYVRAFLSWCVRDGRIGANPAAWNGAVEELPENPGKSERQFWSERDRKSILYFVDRRVDETLDGETDLSRERAFRDRALVYLLALSGVRGAEVFATPGDDRRSGVSWADADLENGTLEVLGKSREYEYAQLPERVCSALARYRGISNPPSEDSPIFPTDHAPTKYRAVREQLAGAIDAAEIEDLLEQRAVDELVEEFSITLPSITTNGARNLMQRLCDEADLDIEGDYLKPHGARRGLGHELYSKGHAELAQSALRHSSIETTHESYSDIQATETAKRVDEILNED